MSALEAPVDVDVGQPRHTSLGASHLEAWLRGRQIHHTFHSRSEEDIPADEIVKSIVFEVDGNPVVAVVALQQRVDMKKLAAHCNVKRRAVKMAATADVPRFCGFVVGCVPPLGHTPPLPVFVDTSLASRGLVYGGGGDPALELCVSMLDVLAQPGVRLRDIAVDESRSATDPLTVSTPPDPVAGGANDGPPGRRSNGDVGSSVSNGDGDGAALDAPLQDAAPGDSAAAGDAAGNGSFERPTTAAAAVIDARIEPSDIPRDAVPQNSRPETASSVSSADDGASTTTAFAYNGTAAMDARIGDGVDWSQSEDELDGAEGREASRLQDGGLEAGLGRLWPPGAQAVKLRAAVQSRRRVGKLLVFATLIPVEVLVGEGLSCRRHAWQHPETGEPCEVQLIMGQTLTKRLGVNAAASLMRKVKPGCVIEFTGVPQAPPPPPAVDGESSDAPSTSNAVARGAVIDCVCYGVEVVSDNAGAHQNTRRSANSLPALAYAPGIASAPTNQYAPQRRQSSTTTARGGVARYQLPLGRDAVMVVDTLDALAAMSRHILGADADGSEGRASSSLTHAQVTVVGMDCEWHPYYRGQAATPVSILQLATRSQAFIVDMQALCRSVRAAVGAAAAPAGVSSSPSDGAESGAGGVGNAGEAQRAQSPAEADRSGTNAQLCWEMASQVVGADGEGAAKTVPDAEPLGARGSAQEVAKKKGRVAARHQQQHTRPAADKAPPPAKRPWQDTHPHLLQLTETEAALSRFLARFFAATHVVKLGFVFQCDLHQLLASFPHLPCFSAVPVRAHFPRFSPVITARRTPYYQAQLAKARGGARPGAGPPQQLAATESVCSDSGSGGAVAGALELNGYVDLQYMACQCQPAQRLKLERCSLKNMVGTLLGQALDKREQCSSWAQRPLTAEQLEYAANDAHVLVVMFDLLAGVHPGGLTVETFAGWRNAHALLELVCEQKQTAKAA